MSWASELRAGGRGVEGIGARLRLTRGAEAVKAVRGHQTQRYRALRYVSCAPSATVHLGLVLSCKIHLVRELLTCKRWCLGVHFARAGRILTSHLDRRPSDPPAQVCVKWHTYTCAVLCAVTYPESKVHLSFALV
jgi:hypothetical protein